MTPRWLLFSGKLLTGLLLAVLVATPFADVAVYGLHDHISAHEGEGLRFSRTADLHEAHHHCDLSVNPAEVAPDEPLVAPAVLVCLIADAAPSRAQHVPRVLLAPPRA